MNFLYKYTKISTKYVKISHFFSVRDSYYFIHFGMFSYIYKNEKKFLKRSEIRITQSMIATIAPCNKALLIFNRVECFKEKFKNNFFTQL